MKINKNTINKIARLSRIKLDDKESEDSAEIQHAFDMLREERNFKLVESDWTALPDSALSDDDKKKWTDYRKLLRDFPATLDNSSVLGDITWPTKP